MPAVLLVLPSRPDDQTRRVHQMLVEHLPNQFECETRKIGPGGHHGGVVSATLDLRRHRTDVVVAFGLSALAAAVFAGLRRVLFVPDRLGPTQLRWARSLCSGRDVDILCQTWTQHRRAVTAGLAPGRCHVAYPGVDFGRLRRNPDLRRILNLSADDYVIVAPGEITLGSGHDLALWSTGILHVLDARYKLLVVGGGDRADTLVRLAGKLKQTGTLRVAGRVDSTLRDEDILSVADAALFTPPRSSEVVLPIATAMAAGVPIVSTVTRAVSELLEDRHTGLMVSKPSPRALASRVLDLRADADLAYRLADTARSEAYQHWSKTKMLDRWMGILNARAAGKPVGESAAVSHVSR